MNQAPQYSDPPKSGPKKILLIAGVAIVAALVLFFVFNYYKGETLPKDAEASMEYVRNFNNTIASSPDDAYEQFAAQSKPDRMQYDASAEFLGEEVDTENCIYDSFEASATTESLTLACSIKSSESKVKIKYDLLKTGSGFSILQYSYVE